MNKELTGQESLVLNGIYRERRFKYLDPDEESVPRAWPAFIKQKTNALFLPVWCGRCYCTDQNRGPYHDERNRYIWNVDISKTINISIYKGSKKRKIVRNPLKQDGDYKVMKTAIFGTHVDRRGMIEGRKWIRRRCSGCKTLDNGLHFM